MSQPLICGARNMRSDENATHTPLWHFDDARKVTIIFVFNEL